MKLIKNINEMARYSSLSGDLQQVAERLAEFWKERASNLSDDQLREAMAMDMENVPGIEGDPELMDRLIPIVMAMVRGEQ